MKSTAARLALALALTLLVSGCKSRQQETNSSGLSIGLMLVPSKDETKITPVAMLIGDGFIIKRGTPAWLIKGSYPDGLPHFYGTSLEFTDGYPEQAGVIHAHPSLLKVTPGMGWGVHEPVFFGPAIDQTTLDALDTAWVEFSLWYLKRNYEFEIQHFCWQIKPVADLDAMLLPLDD